MMILLFRHSASLSAALDRLDRPEHSLLLDLRNMLSFMDHAYSDNLVLMNKLPFRQALLREFFPSCKTAKDNPC